MINTQLTLTYSKIGGFVCFGIAIWLIMLEQYTEAEVWGLAGAGVFGSKNISTMRNPNK